ncbi:MAG: hypothetical protein LBI27_03090 [Clostridiales bacterium]|nr:hypothetical protein [Clostridiales bacterium]
MGDLSVSLPAYFGYAGVRAVKERGCFLISSANAKIHKSNNFPHEICARFTFLKELEASGFPYTDMIIPTVSGVPFVNLGRDIFVMTRHISGREPDFGNLRDISLVIEGLARFHSSARGLKSSKKFSSEPSLSTVFAKNISALNSCVKQINRRPRLSDFDVLVLKHADAYVERATLAAEILAQTDYAALHADALANKHICHNALKEETFSILENTCFISHFEETSVDLQLADLVSILRRYARKTSREVSVSQLLEIYSKILPLPSDAKKIIYAQLFFPWPFLKIVSQYYSKKRNFIPAAITSRMEGILKEQECYDEYIAPLA